jgi:cell fate regulator YaaT (PSP1 superfamily)
MRYNEGDFKIPEAYKVPYVEIRPEEKTEDDRRRERQAIMMRENGGQAGSWRGMGGEGGRPRKLLFIVSFKCSRVEVFYLLDNTGLDIREGDLVIVEADRGQDLGTVQHANVTPDQARLYKRKYAEEQYKWLMMFSRSNQPGNVNPNAQLYAETSSAASTRGNGSNTGLLANAPATMQGLPRENFNNLKPKAIKRLASSHEIKMLAEKEGNEAKAKRTCQQKVAHLHLQMEILDAEWQW